MTEELQERFLEHLRHEGRGRDTIRRYRRALSDVYLADPEVIRIRMALKRDDLSYDDVLDIVAEHLKALDLGTGRCEPVAIFLGRYPVYVDEITYPFK